MLVLNAEMVRAGVTMPQLIAALESAFRQDHIIPARQISEVPGGRGRLFVSMPAFDAMGRTAVKMATIFPDNVGRGLPAIQAAIVVFSETGTPLAVLDGTVVTRLRTGAASALASKYLSRADSSHLVIIGTGALAPSMAAAHCAARPISLVTVWGRRADRVESTANEIRALVNPKVQVVTTSSLEEAVGTADIVSCATSSATPVFAGKWLRPGAFVDLVGSFSPATRESDDDAVLRSRIFVDTFAGALAEAGDLLIPLARGVIERRKIEGELADLVRGNVRGRTSKDEIILFKSVGTAIEDIAAAQILIEEALKTRGNERTPQ